MHIEVIGISEKVDRGGFLLEFTGMWKKMLNVTRYHWEYSDINKIDLLSIQQKLDDLLCFDKREEQKTVAQESPNSNILAVH